MYDVGAGCVRSVPLYHHHHPTTHSIEYNVSYVYHAMYAYFDRDNVGLPGFAQYFKNESDEERGHAELLMKYQNVRGGKVKLFPLLTPELEFSNEAKGDALYAMELALSLEKVLGIVVCMYVWCVCMVCVVCSVWCVVCVHRDLAMTTP